MNLVVIGGGCYGCLHTRQLLKAARRGKIAPSAILVVDHNPACAARTEFAGEPLVRVVQAEWSDFLLEYLADLPEETEDQLVPAPLAPHLALHWLREALAPQARLALGRCTLGLGLPYEQTTASGARAISAADWLCPVTCIEPARCPAIHGERTWELGEIVRAGATGYDAVELFTCRHFAWGVGTIPLASLLAARCRLAALLATSGPRRLLIGTVSACHGLLGELCTEAQPAVPR